MAFFDQICLGYGHKDNEFIYSDKWIRMSDYTFGSYNS